MFELKPLRREALSEALEKARHYRLLNEPVEAESICLDILNLEPENEEALVTLLLSLTDQFGGHLKTTFIRAREATCRLKSDYDQAYYGGLVCERRAKVHLDRGGPGSGHVAYDWFRKAMDAYEEALQIEKSASDPILRWNTCARLIMQHPELEEEPVERREHLLDAGPPSREI